MSVVVVVQGLRKSYGPVVAIDGVSFQVEEGEVFGLLGPNGAGKTTTIECLEGLRRPDGGVVRVLGCDPWRQRRDLAVAIGAQLQETSLPDRLTVGEALRLFASLYPHRNDLVGLLEQLGLAGQERTPFGKLSGGQKQRLFVALALVHDPPLLFLDELTTGLDPHGRRAVWQLIRATRDRGKTIILSTHLMEEAEALCDRVGVLHRGRLVALDTPDRLARQVVGGFRLTIGVAASQDLGWLAAFPGVREMSAGPDEITLQVGDERAVADVIAALVNRGAALRQLRVERPTLEEAFMRLTTPLAEGRGA